MITKIILQRKKWGGLGSIPCVWMSQWLNKMNAWRNYLYKPSRDYFVQNSALKITSFSAWLQECCSPFSMSTIDMEPKWCSWNTKLLGICSTLQGKQWTLKRGRGWGGGSADIMCMDVTVNEQNENLKGSFVFFCLFFVKQNNKNKSKSRQHDGVGF